MSRVLPSVSMAVLCERVMQETDGVLSLIRIVDTFVYGPEGTGQDRATVNVHGVVSLKSGDAVGEYEIRLLLRTPSRIVDLGDDLRWRVRFNGYEHGANFAFGFDLPATEFGLFWIDVHCEGERLTSIPLKLVGPTSVGDSGEAVSNP